MDVEIRDDMIRLGQVLKLAGVVEDGAQAREAIEAGEVTVNDEVETRVTDETLRRIRSKLSSADSNVLIETVWGYGYRLRSKEGGA